MKAGKRTLLLALELSRDATERLLDRGIPPACLPPRDEVLQAVWPLARKLAKSKKLTRQCREAHEIATQYGATVQARQAAALDVLVAKWCRAGGEHRPVTWGHLADFDPARWRVALQPAAVSAKEAA